MLHYREMKTAIAKSDVLSDNMQEKYWQAVLAASLKTGDAALLSLRMATC